MLILCLVFLLVVFQEEGKLAQKKVAVLGTHGILSLDFISRLLSILVLNPLYFYGKSLIM